MIIQDALDSFRNLRNSGSGNGAVQPGENRDECILFLAMSNDYSILSAWSIAFGGDAGLRLSASVAPIPKATKLDTVARGRGVGSGTNVRRVVRAVPTDALSRREWLEGQRYKRVHDSSGKGAAV